MTFSRKTLFSVMQVKTRSLHGFHLDPAITFLNHIILIQQENIYNLKNRCERLLIPPVVEIRLVPGPDLGTFRSRLLSAKGGLMGTKKVGTLSSRQKRAKITIPHFIKF